ncbi:hypothetical protein ACROYT_G011426 [Oculina patagonica]
MNPAKIALKIAVLVCLIAFIEAATEYVSNAPRSKAELEEKCKEAFMGDAVLMLKQSRVYDSYEDRKCDDTDMGPPPRGDFPVKYSLKARLVNPTGYTKDGKQEYIVTCCYKQPLSRRGMMY